MKKMHRLACAAIIMTMTTSHLQAVCLAPAPKPCRSTCLDGKSRPVADVEERTDLGGYGYERLRRVPSLAPAIILGTAMLSAIIAVALQNTSHVSHSHTHSHFASECESPCF